MKRINQHHNNQQAQQLTTESNYSPISTLERQYASPAGRRYHIFIKTNANCCLVGGVEALLKQQRAAGANNPMASTAAGVHPTTLSPAVSTSSDTAYSHGADASYSESPASTDNVDPFAFLNDPAASSAAAPPSQSRLRPHQQVGNFFKKVAKQTQQNIERGMTNLAIKADQGKNPDWLCVGLYMANNTSHVLAMTDLQVLPMTDAERMQGVAFRIPLTVPPGLPPTTVLSLQLWIKSGATLLKGVASKFYPLGCCQFSTGQLEQCLTAVSSSSTHSILSAHWNVPLQSHVIVDGQLHLLISRDLKFPPLTGPGWSLTDPDAQAYVQPHPNFHLPLDQSYGHYTTIANPDSPLAAAAAAASNHHWNIATERATESAVVLPIATAYAHLARQACQTSLTHATSVQQLLLANRHDFKDAGSQEKAECTIHIGYLLVQDAASKHANLSIHWQRPDSIFEVELLPPTKLACHTMNVPFQAHIQETFYPKIVKEGILPGILASQKQKVPFMMGNVRLQLSVSTPKTSTAADPFGSIGSGMQAIASEVETWQATFRLESIRGDQTMQVPVFQLSTGVEMGSIVLQVHLRVPQQQQQPVTPSVSISSPRGGLVSLVGMDTLMEDKGTMPLIDFEIPPTQLDPTTERRNAQLKTMGNFMTHQYLHQHISDVRSVDMAKLMDRLEQYQLALTPNPNLGAEPITESHVDRKPKAFRPSSSRSTELLAGIGFNVHVATMSLPDRFFHNITCGAPADHARGFSAVYPGGPGGGLRRLEQSRLDMAAKLQEAQSKLIQAVAQFFITARQRNHTVHHIPARTPQVAQLRWSLYELTHNLHTLTWNCAIRRQGVFSQALGIAVSSYLTCLSDPSKREWPDIWVRHGFLVSFEGLLSAAGKEMCMIEDASVGISMLKMVSVVLHPSEGNPLQTTTNKVNIQSPYLRWVSINVTGVGSQTQYQVIIGVDPQYYHSRLPNPVKNGAAVRFYPLLYQVGVDIRQAAAHTQMNVKHQIQQQVIHRSHQADGAISDDEDEAGVPDSDLLVALNYEALRKMNTYAHEISPIAPANNMDSNEALLIDTASASQQPSFKVHPVLVYLHTQIIQSAGKMNHGILLEAAAVAGKLGGGGVVFCKSGKDRTAMHVTYKQAQYVHQHILQQDRQNAGEDAEKAIYQDATQLRVHGTRLPICEKNVGQAKYAFNTLQVRFMPDSLKPPIQTLAGFLKGGAVFKGGGIES